MNDLDIQCVIVAGGKGSRLRPFTENIPKSMIPIHGLPFLHWLIKRISNHNISRFLILTGYGGNQIQDYFGDGNKFDCSIDYSHEEHPLGSGGALWAASKFLDNEFFYVNGDDYLDINFMKMMYNFKKNNVLAMVAVNMNSNGQLKVDEQTGLVTDFTLSYSNPYLDCGTKIFNKSMITLFSPECPFDLEPKLWPILIEKQELAVFPINSVGRGINTKKQLEEFISWFGNTEFLLQRNSSG